MRWPESLFRAGWIFLWHTCADALLISIFICFKELFIDFPIRTLLFGSKGGFFFRWELVRHVWLKLVQRWLLPLRHLHFPPNALSIHVRMRAGGAVNSAPGSGQGGCSAAWAVCLRLRERARGTRLSGGSCFISREKLKCFVESYEAWFSHVGFLQQHCYQLLRRINSVSKNRTIKGNPRRVGVRGQFHESYKANETMVLCSSMVQSIALRPHRKVIGLNPSYRHFSPHVHLH